MWCRSAIKTQWRFDPFSGEVTEGAIWGRGASDMKGAVAAFAIAACAYVAKHGRPRLAKGSIGFLITGDEEGPAVNGTVKLLDWAQRVASISIIVSSASRPIRMRLAI